MSDENDKKWFDKKISRRDFLKKAGMVGAGAAIGASGAGAIFANIRFTFYRQGRNKTDVQGLDRLF